MRLFRNWFKNSGIPEGKIALALGGGGTRGVAHLGILKFLEEHEYLDYDFIVGTSAGAVFGSLYLLSNDADEAIGRLARAIEILDKKKSLINIAAKKSNFLSNLKEKLYLAKSIFSLSVIGEEPMKEFLMTLLGDHPHFSDLRKPLYVVATDLYSGRDVVFSQGELIQPLMASSAIPGAFPPFSYKIYYLIDGGSTQKLPAKIARRLGADRVMGVDVGSGFQIKKHYSSSNQVIGRSEEITSNILNQQNLLAADLLLKPGFHDMKWYEFKRYREAFDSGYAEAAGKKKEIEAFFKSRTLKPRGQNRLEDISFILE
jgi:NTE family protein